jgi:hypothetical protein
LHILEESLESPQKLFELFLEHFELFIAKVVSMRVQEVADKAI